jgi:flagellar hook-length control protein FliK
MKVNMMPVVNATSGSQISADIAAPSGSFATALGQKTHQPDNLIQEGPEQPVPLPTVDDLVNLDHELSGDIFDPLGSLPGNKLNGEQKEMVVDNTFVPVGIPIDSQLAQLQMLVVQMDAAAGVAQQTNAVAAVDGDTEGGDVTPANLAQAVLATRNGSAEGSKAAPTAAVVVKQGYDLALPANGEKREEVQVAAELPAPKQLDVPEQMVSQFKPGSESVTALSSGSEPSFTAVSAARSTTTFSLPATHSVSAPVNVAPILTQEVGSIAWQQSLGQQVAMFTRNGIHNAEIRLNPAELGVLKINLRMTSDQASLHFVSENHQVRAALEAAMPQLRTSLAESGIHLEASRVDSGSAQSWSGSAHSEWESGQAAHEDNSREAPQQEDAEVVIHPTQLRLINGINTFV